MLKVFVKDILKKVIHIIGFFSHTVQAFEETRGTVHQISLKQIFYQKILMINSDIPWPALPSTHIGGVKNIKMGVESSLGDNKQIYVQANAPIKIGNYTRIAAYSKLISSNHSIYNHKDRADSNGIVIGDYCWLGIGCVILSNVVLGNHTIVAAGAVVTRPFPDGYCVLAGSPAKIVKYLDREKIVEYKETPEYVGWKRIDRITEKDWFYIGND